MIQKMSKLYWQFFIIVLLLLTCMPIIYIKAPEPVPEINDNAVEVATESNDKLDREIVISQDAEDLAFIFKRNTRFGNFDDVWTTEQIIRYYEYPFEEHVVRTEDGYDLVLHRISPKGNIKRNFPVLIPHCVGGSSGDWVLAGPQGSLAMQLSDQGYDVWLANNRGNTYSRTNVNFTIKNNKFWNFTLHELGTIDLPTIIKYVLDKTIKTQLHYIGYSMSTCIFYIMASERNDFQKFIRSQISMAPVSKLGSSKSSVKKLTTFNRSLDKLLQKTSYGEFNSNKSYMRKLINKFCTNEYPDQTICLKFIIYAICGANKETFNTPLLPRIVGHFPSSTSSKVVAHLAQFMKRDKFARFSYGARGNKNIYGSREPPLYDLENINVPITLIYAENDSLVQPNDVKWLKGKLPRIMDFIKVDDPEFNHLDFVWNLYVKKKINDHVINTLEVTDKLDWEFNGPVLNIVN